MKYVVLFIIFLNYSFATAQIIKGTVTDETNASVSNANILIKKTKTPNVIYRFTSTDENGFYTIRLPIPIDSLLVEVTSINYETIQKDFVAIKKADYPLVVNFNLQKRITSLKEVVIKAKEKPIKVKNDTTVYNPNSFKDGTEKVIEDLLKKLPGIKVEENGEIKFKGKSIKKMLLDGDDLFDAQYAIGSKNIDVDMVDKVQAIENFNENPLLKDINDSEDVALNIKLKKGKTDFSGTAKIGYGLIDKYDASVTELLVNTKNKSFGLLSYNNIGKNNSPYNFQSEIVSVENIREESLLAKDIIQQGNFYSRLEDKHDNLNNNFYFNFNLFHKFSKKLNSRINIGFYDDRLSRVNTTNSEYNLNNTFFTTREDEKIEKNPKIFNSNFLLSKKNSEKTNWEYLGKIKFEENDFTSLSSNNGMLQMNNIKSKSFFTKHNFNLTTLINKKIAFIGSTFYSINNSPQRYLNTPGIVFNENPLFPNVENNQTSTFRKEVMSIKFQLLGYFDDFKWSIQTGFNSTKNKYDSSLQSLNTNNELYTNMLFNNDLIYDVSYPYTNFNLLFKKRKFSFKVGLGTQYYQLKLKDYNSLFTITNDELVFSPVIKLLYNFSNKTTLIVSYDYNEVSPKETNQFQGFVQTSYRSFQNNEINTAFLKTHNYGLTFNYNDFFNLMRFQMILNYNSKDNNYFTKSQITQNTTTTTSFFSNAPNEDYIVMVSGEKYFHFIRTTIQLNSNYALSFFNDMVNNSFLRDVESRNWNVDLTLRTGLKSSLNYETKTLFSNAIYKLKDSNKNYFNTLNQSFKIIYKASNNLIANSTINFISNDLSENNNYWFLDCEVSFTTKNKKIEYSIVARNLTNNKTFETISVSDYSRTTSSYNLINRYVLGSISFKF